VQFCTKCAVLVLIGAVLTAHLSGGTNSAPQASWLDFEEGREKGGKRKETGRKIGGAFTAKSIKPVSFDANQIGYSD